MSVLLCMPFLTVGGAEASVSRICAHLKQLGVRIHIITTVRTPKSAQDTTAWFLPNTVAVHHLPRTLRSRKWPLFLLDLIHKNSIDVVWLVGSSFVYEQLPKIKKLFPGVPVVDLLFNSVGHTADHMKHGALIDHTVVEHAAMKKWLADRGEPADQISIIPNGIDLKLFEPPARIPRNSANGAKPPFVVAFAGRLSEEKAPDTFLWIASRFKDRPEIEFRILGEGNMAGQLGLMRARLGLNGQVRFTGFRPAHEFLSDCDALVVCSRIDGRPNVIMESLAMGVPVIASRVGSIPEMAPEGQGAILCEAEDVEGFYAAISSLANDAERCSQLGAAGRQWAQQQFSIADAGARYEQLFRTMMERAAPKARPVRRSDVLTAASVTRQLVRRIYRMSRQAIAGGQ
jgi:O-antigen biosynthesis protein